MVEWARDVQSLKVRGRHKRVFADWARVDDQVTLYPSARRTRRMCSRLGFSSVPGTQM